VTFRVTTADKTQNQNFQATGRSALPETDFDWIEIGDQNNAHGTLWYAEPDAIRNAIDYAKFYSRSHDAVIRVYDEAGNVIDTHEQERR
jgi:hypothetical protein